MSDTMRELLNKLRGPVSTHVYGVVRQECAGWIEVALPAHDAEVARKAQLEEARWWHQLHMLNSHEGIADCTVCSRIAWLESGIAAPQPMEGKVVSDMGKVSDGFHTFDELYEHRHALFLVVCVDNEGWKSKLHSDGTMFSGWFIAGVGTPLGQATYHLPISWWDRYTITELDRAPEWDGHTSAQVPERISSLARLVTGSDGKQYRMCDRNIPG